MVHSKKQSVGFLLAVLIVLAFAIGFIYSWDCSSLDNGALEEVKVSGTQEYVEILGEKEISEKSVIISDRFVQKFDPNGNIVVLGSDGSAYNVQNGAVLVSGVLIDVEEGSSYTIQRIDEMEKSIYN